MAVTLQDKVAIITGGATGIGEAVTHKFASLGARVVVCGLPGDPVPEVTRTIQESGGHAISFIGDIAVESQAELCVQAAVEEFGRLDILAHLAAAPLAAMATEHYRVSDFDRVLYANIRSAFLMTHFALPELKKTRGCIVASASEAAGLDLSINPAQTATRAWVHAFIKGVAGENAADGVRANCVCSGAVEAGWTHAFRELDPELEEEIVRSTPLARRGTPEEVAAVYAFLASPDASFVTGALYTADGGMHLGIPPYRREEIRSFDRDSLRRDQEPRRRSEDALI